MSLSDKICQYSFCESPQFKGAKAQKYCNIHKNKVCRVCKELKEDKVILNWRSLCRKCESKRVSLYLKNKRKESPEFFKTEKKLIQKRIQRKKYIQKNPEKIKDYYWENKSEILEKHKKYYQFNRENILNRNLKWRRNNLERHKELNKKSNYKFRKSNPHIVAWRNLLHRVLKQFGKNKFGKTYNTLGYSSDQLRKNIESKFQIGMSWGNYGDWHIDHIRPVSSFEKNTLVSIVNCLDNLRPLWAIDNLSRKRIYVENS